MKAFFRDYSYYSVKMFLNQFAIGLFGLSLSMAFGSAGSNNGRLVSSICSVLFYLFLIYYMTWEVGSKDSVGIKNGKIKEVPLRGLYMSLLANSLNFLLALLFAAGAKISGIFALVIEGMYTGIMATEYTTVIQNGEPTGLPLNTAWWAYFVIIIPALLTATVSYYLGTKNIHFTPLFNPTNPEKEEIRRMKKQGKRDNK
jgi:hypothetical protein